MSNLSIQYNFQVIVVALKLLEPYDEISTWQKGTISSLVFAGAVVGQLTMGYAGDMLGRRKAMMLTNSLTVAGAIGSAVAWGPASTLYPVIMACRFFIGIGVGGKYPLAATMRSESDDDGSKSQSKVSMEVAKGFFWQTPGAMLPYILALILLAAVGETRDSVLDHTLTQWFYRTLLALGALPSLIVIVASYLSTESESFVKAREQMKEENGTANPLVIACKHRHLWGKLAGAGLSWFLYDFMYYGLSLTQPAILARVFGKGDGLFAICWQCLVISSMGIPAVVLAIWALKAMTSKQLQAWGFVFIGVIFAVFGVLLKFTDQKWASFAVLSMLIASVNWGPNVSTYVIPTEVFPSAVRSSMFGMASAMGKFGALLGGTFFTFIAQETSYSILYFICVGVCFLALLVTHFLIPSDGGERTFGCSARRRSEDRLLDATTVNFSSDYLQP